MVDANVDPARIVDQVVDAIGAGFAQLGNHEVIHPHRLGLALGLPFASGILEIAHQFLLLGIHRNGWFSGGDLLLHTLVDMPELGISVDMGAAFARLLVGLQAVAQVMKHGAYHIPPHHVAHAPQFRRQPAHAFAGPAQG